MGAGNWSYVTQYAGTVGDSLAALQARVFAEEFGEGGDYPDLAALWADHEFMGTQGTHTVLDVVRVRRDPVPRYGSVHPLGGDRLLHHFGTRRPTVAQYEEAVARSERAVSHEEYERSLMGEVSLTGSGLYVLLFDGGPGTGLLGEPTHVGFHGCSGD